MERLQMSSDVIVGQVDKGLSSLVSCFIVSLLQPRVRWEERMAIKEKGQTHKDVHTSW